MSEQGNVDHLVAAMRETLAEMTAVTEDLRRESALMNAEVEAERAALRAERDRALDDYAELARDGGAGEAREELQRRIDEDETTWLDVMSGVDTHWSAVEVRADIEGGIHEYVWVGAFHTGTIHEIDSEAVMYRSGIEFVDMPAWVGNALAQFLDAVKTGRQA